MSTAVPLPGMDVESRVSTTAHTIPVPDETESFLCQQLEIATILNDEAKSGPKWPIYTLDYMSSSCKISPAPTHAEIKNSLALVTRFNSWKEAVYFVQDDICVDFFSKALAYLLRVNAVHVNDEDFIDGHGVGYTQQYLTRLKVTLEQAFDAKWFYQVKRPLVYSLERNNIDLTRIANAIHPGHWSYPAGHGTKFFTAVEVLNTVFTLSPEQYRNIFIAAHVCAMGRSGNLIHYPVDNDKGGYLTNLPEFNS